jgi:hypothetical protein
MTISNGDVLKVFLELVLADGTIAQNVYHLRAAFADDQSDAAVSAVVETYLEDIMGDVAAYLSNSFTINPSWLNRVAWDPVGAKWAVDYLVDIFTPSFTHTNTDDPFPNQIAPVMVGNSYSPTTRGRKFLPGFVETAADGGSLVVAAVTALVAAVADYISPVVVSAGNNLVPGVPDQDSSTFWTFRDGVANTIVGTQRRRKPGVGE